MSNYLDNTQTRMIGISDHMRTFSSFPWCPLRTSLSTLWHIRMCLPSSHPSIDPSERQKAYGQRKETVSDNPMFKRRVDQVDQSCVHFHRCAYLHTLSSPNTPYLLHRRSSRCGLLQAPSSPCSFLLCLVLPSPSLSTAGLFPLRFPLLLPGRT